MIDARQLPPDPIEVRASAEECTALAQRFGLVRVKHLSARITLTRDGPTVRAAGQLNADIVQGCAISAEDLPVRIHEPVALHFVPANSTRATDAEVELAAEQLDQIEMDGHQFDLGEALAQGLALAIDPYAEGPGAVEARQKLAEQEPSGPFAMLKKLLEG
jgi:uncharacterized metal-binding protein YceD (DUF177 family)